jgi:serine/threonine protein kinase
VNCHKKTYCSRICLNNDWINGHSKECKSAPTKKPLVAVKKVAQKPEESECKEKDRLAQSLQDIKKYEAAAVPGKETNILGKGAYGKVYLIRNKENNMLYAMKVIEKSAKATPDEIMEEVKIHIKLKHENIVRLYEFIESSKKIYMVMEYVENENLYKLILRRKKLSEKDAFLYFRQVCNAVLHLHKNKLMHRDIKPENLLISANGAVKLCDFGYCTSSQECRKNYCGTTEYLAPELLNRYSYNEKVDIWSLGILLFEMLHGKTPFPGKEEPDVLENIQKTEIQFSQDLHEDVKNLISAILVENPERRPTISQILTFPWLKRMQKETTIQIPRTAEPTPKGKKENTVREKYMIEVKKTKIVETRNIEVPAKPLAKTLIQGKINEGPKHLLYGYPVYNPKKTVLFRIGSPLLDLSKIHHTPSSSNSSLPHKL